MVLNRASQLISVGLMLLAAGCAPKPVLPAIAWLESFPLALEFAADSRRPMLVYFNADWCTICRRVERETFTAAAVADALEPFVPVKVDVDRQPWLAQKYHIDATPAYLKLDGTGELMGHALGYKSPDEMEQLLRAWSAEVKTP